MVEVFIHDIVPFLGIGCFFAAIIFAVMALFSLIRKTGNFKRYGITTLSFIGGLLLFGTISYMLFEDYASTEDTVQAEQYSNPFDHNEFVFEIEDVQYNEETDELDVSITTNLPDASFVRVGLTDVEPEETDEVTGSVVNQLTDFEYFMVLRGEINVSFSHEVVPFINGDYRFSVSLDIGEFNTGLGESLGGKTNFEIHFDNIVTHGDEEEYGIYLGQETFTVTDTKSLKDFASEYKSSAEKIRFAELDKNTSPYEGTVTVFKGEIMQVMEDDQFGIIRLAVTEKSFGYSSSDVIYVTYDFPTPFVKDDIVTVYGSVEGSHTYESTAGYNITLPHIKAMFIE
ncbi:hypothetical protein JSY36_08250 [Bacillus sp. H-16]|uniref:hypothetical protein n=1 Tax=Alteribacter salitolerans TaxID=2912333 RepID=UPI0019643E1D|nr:hypothetical protein [Alteribacter salitolerans]MBM7095742.1 hypothetical protein [Alteribacter salitolerans]